MGSKRHLALWAVCDTFDGSTEWRGWTELTHKPDCSTGCRFFHPLEGTAGMDWGVCFNPKSPRKGLLTFEHMGCDMLGAE